MVPAMITAVNVAPCAPLVGVAEVTVGAGGGEITVNPLTRLPLWASVFVTVTVRPPEAAAAPIVMLDVILVEEFRTQVFTVIPTPNEQVGLARNPVPTIAVLTVAP